MFFEGMRAVLLDHVFRLDYLIYSLLLNTVYLGLGVSVFLATIHNARNGVRCCNPGSDFGCFSLNGLLIYRA